jgi:hypothetical protein
MDGSPQEQDRNSCAWSSNETSGTALEGSERALEPEPEPAPQRKPPVVAAQIFDRLHKREGNRAAKYTGATTEYKFPCQCKPQSKGKPCEHCQLQLPDEQLPDGKIATTVPA